MEIDVKTEQDRVRAEINDLATQINSLDQQRQTAVNLLIRKQGELEYLNSVNGDKGEAP